MAKQIFRFSILFLAISFLAGCLYVTTVDQPANAGLGVPFTVTMTVAVGPDTLDESNATPVFGVMLPDSWLVTACSYTGDFSGTCTENPGTNRFENFSPATAGYAWFDYTGEPHVFADSGDETTTVTWQIVPQSLGNYSLNYAAGAFDAGGELQIERTGEGSLGFNQSINITAASQLPVNNSLALILLIVAIMLSGMATLGRRHA